MTLVSAPAGFGKTTCISAWVNGLDLPVTWLSLDALDDDPGRFFTYFVAALQKIDPGLGHEIEGVLRSGQLPPAEVISTTLINDVLAFQGRFLLVLDDFQVIQEGFVLQVLQSLVTHLFQANLSQPLHLVLLTREEPSLPLARLRASNQLTEVRARDLRFTRIEAERFLNEAMGLALCPDDVSALEDKTEGWIVGLQLAALAMQAPIARPTSVRDQAPTQLIANLTCPGRKCQGSGSHRHILSYLTEQVLSRQTGEVQDFLLQTSILDRLSGELCNAVTGRTDSHTLLERLFHANLFLIPLDDEGRWYRYHQLFADLIRDLQNARHAKETAELHRRASRWYAQASDQAAPGLGAGGTFVNAGIQHALDAADYALAVELLENHAMDMIMQWHAKMVNRWMQALPAEWAAQSPKTNLAFAWTHLMHGDAVQAAPYLARLQAMFSGSPLVEKDPALQAEWLALQSTLLNAQGKPAESVELAHQALAIAPQQEGHVHSLIYLGLAGAYQQLDDYTRAAEAYQMIIQHGRAAGNLTAEMLGISGLALMTLQHGQLYLAFELARQGIERIERSGVLPPISAAVYGELGQVYYHWHQLDQARTHFARAAQVSALSGYSDAEIYHGVIRSRLLHIEGDVEAAAQEMHQVADLMQADAPVAVREEVIAQQVRIHLAQDHLTAAETALKRGGFSSQGQGLIPELEPDPHINHPLGLLYNSALRILLYRAQVRHELTSLQRGLALADRLIAGALRRGEPVEPQRQYLPVALEALLLRAQMHAIQGNEQAAWADYAHALALAEPEGFISVFVQEGAPVATALRTLIERDRLGDVRPGYVKDILAAFPRSQPPTGSHPDAAAALLDPLTERELDVLRLMTQGLKYKEIAARLFISLNTVRSHVKAIYDKLDVHNRTQAVQKARQLQIL